MPSISRQNIPNYCESSKSSHSETTLPLVQDLSQFLLSKIKENDYSSEELKKQIQLKLNGLTSPLERKEIFKQVETSVLCEASKVQDNLFRTYTLNSLQSFLSDLEESVFQGEGVKLNKGFSSDNRAIETGDSVNQVSLDYWNQLNSSLRLDAGIFSTGSQFVTPYGRLLYSALNYSDDSNAKFSILAQGNTAFGAFITSPQSDAFNAHKIVWGGIPSGDFLLGGRYKISDQLELRSGIENSALIYFGIHGGFALPWDNNAGAGIVYTPSQNYQIGSYGIVSTNVGMSNVQDGTFFRPRYEETSANLFFNNPIINVGIEAESSATGLEGSLNLWRNFPLAGGTLKTSLNVYSTLTGALAANPVSFFLSLAYSHNIDEEQGVSGEVNISMVADNNTIPKIGKIADFLIYQEDAIILYDKIIQDPNTVLHCHDDPSRRDGYVDSHASDCEFDYKVGPMWKNVNVKCFKYDDPNNLSCRVDGITDPKGDPPHAEYYLVEQSFIVHPGKNGHYDFEESIITIDNPIFKPLYEKEELKDFITETASLSTEEKMKYLQYLTRKLYKIYDEAGLAIISGSGKVNDVSKKDIYASIREFALYHQKNPKTICRGIAPFIAYVAHGWGFEAYSAIIQTPGSNHVVSLVKERGGSWNVINFGDQSFESDDQSISKTLDDFTAASGYPPQPYYELYDHNGNYVRRIETNFGNTLFKKTATPKLLPDFLRGN